MNTKPLPMSALALVALALCNCSSESSPESDEVVSESESDLSQSFTGNLSASGTSWVTHSVTITAAGTLDINLDWVNASANLNVFLTGPSGNSVAFQNGSAKPEVLSVDLTETGTYTIGVKCKTGSTAYTLTTDFQPAAHDYPGRPALGKLYWGASISSNGDPVARHENAAGHPLTLHRTFHQWNQRTTRLVDEAADDAAHGRIGWVSVKPPSWAEMGSGVHDAEIDQMLNALDDIDGPVWLTIHHEPEGGGGVNAPDDPAGPA
ncbi:MAG: PPC domain-containing protein, partial [Myxococcales bacterium]|nr:PPC domain-containing protein [Myxococcales bacterium]